MNALVMLAVLGTGQAAAADSAQWLDDYGVALAKCKELGKPLLIVIDQPKDKKARVEQISFRSDGEQKPEPALKHYILCRIDATSDYGQKVAKAFGASSQPYTAIISKSGAGVLYTKSGQFTSEGWKATLVKYQSGVRPVTVQPASYYYPSSYYNSGYSGYSGYGGFYGGFGGFGGGGC